MFGWSGFMKKKPMRKNVHAVALGKLGGLVHSAAKQQVNRENGRKSGQLYRPKKTSAARRNARRPQSAHRKKS
jgi:hypothetical protein